MKTIQLSNSNITVPKLAFGGNVFGWTIDEGMSFKILDKLFESGYNFIDTADVYSRWKPGNMGGESETIIGKWMKERNNREKIVIATKGGGDMGSGKSLSKGNLGGAIDASLKKLNTDYIDLYQVHFDDLNTPVGETLDALNEFVASGKVKLIGASNFSKERLKESLEYCAENQISSYQTFQPEYNLYSRKEFEDNYERICDENNITVLCYYALASGFLSGKYRSEADYNKSSRGGGMTKYMNERGFRILDALDKVSEIHNSVPSTISLAWLQSKNGIIPIASATSVGQLEQLIDADAINLTANDLEILDKASGY